MPTVVCPYHGPYETVSLRYIEACLKCAEDVKREKTFTCPKLFTSGGCDGTCIICQGVVVNDKQQKP